MYRNVKKRTFEIIESAHNDDIKSKIFDIFIISLIVINLVIVIAETFTLPEQLVNVLDIIEDISIGIFTVEYMLRIWTADLLYAVFACKSKAAIHFLVYGID